MNAFRSALPAIALALTLAAPASAQPPDRFDYLVREDMFKGLRGDEQAFARAMALCERRLAESPNDPEALVWHGAGLMFRGGRALAAGGGDQATGLAQRGFSEMAKAVALAPDTVAVLIPRATSLLAAGKQMPDAERARAFIRIAIGDFEKALAVQQPHFAALSVHAKGELIGALADGWWQLGDLKKSREFLGQLVADLPGSKYAAAARSRLDNSADRQPVTCLGCHTR